MRALVPTGMVFELHTGVRAGCVPRDHGVTQGSSTSPLGFTLPLVGAVAAFLVRAERHNWGIKLDGRRVVLVAWADDLWLFGRRPADTQAACEGLAACLRERASLAVDWAHKAEWSSTDAAAASSTIRGQGAVVPYRDRGTGVTALGSLVPLSG